jgi:hypothetical protein
MRSYALTCVYCMKYVYILDVFENDCQSYWPRCLRRWSAAVRLVGLWVRIPPRAWMFVCCDYRVLSGRGPCDELIIRPEESYRMWCVLECNLETSWMRRPWPTWGCCAKLRKRLQFLPYGRSIGSWICLTHKTYTCHTVQNTIRYDIR